MSGRNGVGARMRAARTSRRMSQETLADLANVDQTAISKVERGSRNFDPSTLGRVADALGVSYRWLVDGEGQGPVDGEPAPRQNAVRKAVSAPQEAPLPLAGPTATAFDEALEAAFDKTRGHRLADVDTVRRLFGAETPSASSTPEELERVALRLLDTVAAMRADGEEPTLARVTFRVAT